MSNKSNLVVFITDQERATQHFGGTTHADDLAWEQKHLPHLTWLKNEGVSFRNAYCNTTMCTPSRSTLFTGLYPAHHMAKDTLTDGGDYSLSEYTLDPQIVNMAHLFLNNGYQVHYRGKWHLSKNGEDNTTYVRPADVAQFGFEGWQAPDSGQDTKVTNFGGGFVNHDGNYIQQVMEFLATVDSNKPFLLICSLVNPHDVLSYPQTWEYGYTEEDFKGDVPLDYTETNGEILSENYKPRAQVEALRGSQKLLGPLLDPDKQLAYLNFYANLIKKQDSYLGDVLNGLRDNGLMDTTAIIRIADHGELGVSHGGMRQKAFVAYEEALKVPIVVRLPDRAENQKGVEVDHLASLLDLMPTLSDWLGEDDLQDKLPGHSLLPIIDNPTDAESVQKYLLYTFDDLRASNPNEIAINNVANRIRMVRNDRWKFSHYFHSEDKAQPEYELYDLQEDDIEYYNLYHPEVVDALIESGKRPESYRKTVKKALKKMKKLLDKAQDERLWSYQPTYTKDYLKSLS